jgi:3-hydroxyisobutyrate dehydrogenase-like beta-hydroxyacid dehydrogenase
MEIGVSSPGAMGVTIASILQSNGHNVYWASNGRSEESQHRADKFNLVDCLTIENLCKKCDFIFSILPGDTAAFEFATTISKAGFNGVFVDANTLYSDASIEKLKEIADSSEFFFAQMAIRGFPIEDKRPIYSETNKLYIEYGIEKLLCHMLKNDNWEIHVVKENLSKNIIRNWVS